MKPLHLPITGHDLLAVERFRDSTRHMIEFLVLAAPALPDRRVFPRCRLDCCPRYHPSTTRARLSSSWDACRQWTTPGHR